MSPQLEILMNHIKSHEVRVGIIGLGHAGLPLALAFAEKKFRAHGFDIDQVKTNMISRQESYLKHIPASRVAGVVQGGYLVATSSFDPLKDQDVIIICVPTPLTASHQPDVSYIVNTGREIKNRLRKGQLIILESTTYPGTTEELLLSLLQESGLKCGEDFFLAFSPEREDPGNVEFGMSKIPKVVSGIDQASGDLAQALYNEIVELTVRVSSTRVAEATKLTENIFRAVNIALVNELKMVYDGMGIDIWEVMDAAATKPFGFMRFNPGPGWGGHCIPLDPFYLTWKAQEYGITPKFIELAGKINADMPQWIVGKISAALKNQGQAVKGSRILLLGLAYKRDIADTRESPAFGIMSLLEKLGAKLNYHDPLVPEITMTRHFPERAGMSSINLTPESLQSYDVVLVVTDHTDVDYALVAKHAKLIVDSRGIYHQRFPHLKGKIIPA